MFYLIFIYAATFGGLASLTLGASFLSIVEFLYYWTGLFGTGIWQRLIRCRRKCSFNTNHLIYPKDFKNEKKKSRSKKKMFKKLLAGKKLFK